MPYEQDLAAIGARADADIAAAVAADHQAELADLTARLLAATDQVGVLTSFNAGLTGQVQAQLAEIAALKAQIAVLTAPPPPVTPPVVVANPLTQVYPGFTKVLAEDFTTAAAAGTAYTSYASVMAGYGDTATYRVGNVSVHDSYLDIALQSGTSLLPGSGGVVVIGPAASRWGRLYGKFTVKFKATGASTTGAAFMLWPTSNKWSDGEIDYPEGSFGGSINLFHHPSPCYPDQNAPVAGMPYCGTNAASLDTKATWRDWHTASIEWTATALRYYLDDVLIKTVRDNLPVGNHRWTIQAADPQKLNTGEAGHLLIDWVRIDSVA